MHASFTGLMFIETSALDATNVENAFIDSLSKIYDVVSEVNMFPSLFLHSLTIFGLRITRSLTRGSTSAIYKFPLP